MPPARRRTRPWGASSGANRCHAPYPHGGGGGTLARPHTTKGAMGIVSWIVLGAIVGFAVNWLVSGRFPGGIPGTVVAGAAGAFIGGAAFSLVADRAVSSLDALSLLIAFAGAALLLTAVRKAGYAAPRPH